MKEFKREIPKNTYTLSEMDISVIHALCFYAPEGMTKEAEKSMYKMEKLFRMHDVICNKKVWLD